MNWTLENVVDYIESCYDRDTILDVLMGYSGHWFPARMVLIVGRAWVQLFATTAFDLPEDLPRESRRADVDDDAPAISAEVSTGTVEEVGLGGLFAQLSLGRPLVRTVGVKIGNRVAIVLVGIIHAEDVDTNGLEVAATHAGRQLEDVIRMAKSDSLPPEGDRIPPFPELPQSEPSEAFMPATDGRTTQNLRDFDPDVAVSTPRLSLTVPDDDDDAGAEDGEVNSNATSFGLPFVKGGAKPPPLPSDAVGAAPGTEADSAVEEIEDEHPETLIGSPFLDDKFPGEIDVPIVLDEEPSEDSDAIDLGEPVDDGGVQVVRPNPVANEAGRTQLGGLSASADILGGLGQPASSAVSEAEEAPSTIIGKPMRREPSSTYIGGVRAEEAAVSETLDRVESEAAEAKAAASEPSPATSTNSGPELTGAWVNARSKAGVPTAMILKPARKRRASSAGESPKPVDTPAARPAETQKEPATAAKTDSPVSEAADEPGPAPAPEPSSEDVIPDESSAATSETNRTSFGAWNRDEDNRPRKFDADAEVDDAWFDYFADEAKDAPPADVETALNFSLSEPSDDPHTIPPETLERLLDSGPAMVDMQEQFMVLDSRDRDKAFEAAERVAELGEKAAEVLDLMFPGRVFLDRYQYGEDLPPVEQHGPVLHALVRLADLALPIAHRHLTDSSNEARFYAVYLLTRLDAEPLLGDLFDRMLDRDQQIRRVAADIVLQYQSAPTFKAEIRDRVRAELKSGDDVHVSVAAGLMARLRDTEAVGALIDAMEEASTPRVKLALLNALTEITLHTWSSPYEWRQWWKKAKSERREDWIVEALDAPSDDLRELAHAEVQRIPGLELNYHPDQPPKLRKRAQTDLRAWFEKLRK